MCDCVESVVSVRLVLEERCCCGGFFFLVKRRPPRSTQSRSSAASDVYKGQALHPPLVLRSAGAAGGAGLRVAGFLAMASRRVPPVSYTHLRAHETVLDLVCRLLLEKKQPTLKQSLLTLLRIAQPNQPLVHSYYA